MKRVIAVALFAAVGVSMAFGEGEAAWKKRGWYMPKQGANCVMRNPEPLTEIMPQGAPGNPT